MPTDGISAAKFKYNGDFGVAVFAQLSDKQGSLTVREHYASLWSLSIKTLVPNILNATGAVAWRVR